MSAVRSSAPQFTQEPVLNHIDPEQNEQLKTVKNLSTKGESGEISRQKSKGAMQSISAFQVETT